MTLPLTKRSELLARLRDICLPLPECKEKLTWGNPTFVAGKKQFAVLDRYHDRWCIAFAVIRRSRAFCSSGLAFSPHRTVRSTDGFAAMQKAESAGRTWKNLSSKATGASP